jgi:hypothetical protein
MGSVVVTGMLKVPTSACPSEKGMFPLFTPASMGLHAASAVLCVTVWLPLLNWNMMISPTAAVTELGTKTSWAPPTTTGIILLWRRTTWSALRVSRSRSKVQDQQKHTSFDGKALDRLESRQSSGSCNEQGEHACLHCGGLDCEVRCKEYMGCEAKERVLFNSGLD